MTNRKAATIGTRVRYRHFRDACLAYLEIHGSASVNILMTAVTKANGRAYTMKPQNGNSLNQILSRDKRFELITWNKPENPTPTSRPKSMGGFVWGLVPNYSEVIIRY